MGKLEGRIAAHAFVCCGALLLPALAVNCNEHKDSAPGTAQPEVRPGPAAPAPDAPPATAPEPAPVTPEPAPATRPAETRPAATLPESTYDSTPPYPVSLFVKKPEDKQPGWLRIEQLADDKQVATATGRFPEKNRIYVETGNVRRIRIHVGHLPLRANERVVLQIDKQGMVLSRSRPFTTLERSPTGEWVVQKEP